MIRRIQLAPIVLALGLVSGSAHAALQGRDLNGSAGSFEAYYDIDLTYLAGGCQQRYVTGTTSNYCDPGPDPGPFDSALRGCAPGGVPLNLDR